MQPHDPSGSLYEGLEELVAGAFPRTCRNCGREYADVAQWLRETVPVPRGSGLKAGQGDADDEVVVELFRNCACGSTLLETFGDRRDGSESGERRRTSFGRWVRFLHARGYPMEQARRELIGAMRGTLSPELAEILKEVRERTQSDSARSDAS